MKARRVFYGQEAVEVGLISVILLVLSLGAVVIFGGSIQRVFQDKNSPVIVSAVDMQNSSNTSDAKGAEARTNIDKSLVTTQLVSKARSDYSIESSVGQETSGATGTNLAAAGTKDLNYYDILKETDMNSLDPFLAAAIGSKKTAMQLLADATSAQSNAEVLQDQANNIQKKADQGAIILSEMKAGLDSMVNELNNVDQHLQLIMKLKATAVDVETRVSEALGYTQLINVNIVNQTAINLTQGQALLDMNQDQIAAQALYESMKSDYDSSWTLDCDINGNCSNINTSIYSMGQINSQLAQSNLLLNQVNSQAASLGITIGDLEGVVNSLKQQADKAYKTADSLKDDAKKTIKEAFYDKDLFWGCNTIQDVIKRAEWAVGSGGKAVKDFDAALKAIDLLKASAASYESAKKLTADAQKADDNLEDSKKTLSQLNIDAVNLSLQANKAETATIEADKLASQAVIQAADPEIAAITSELGKVQVTIQNVNSDLAAQKAVVDQLKTDAQTASTNATDAKDTAVKLLAEAQGAVTSATDAINNFLNIK
ncbi:MAG: hypothetical protein AB1782_07375 [Cyanobacteriota bacterium]